MPATTATSAGMTPKLIYRPYAPPYVPLLRPSALSAATTPITATMKMIDSAAANGQLLAPTACW
jgi:hypothetical protein